MPKGQGNSVMQGWNAIAAMPIFSLSSLNALMHLGLMPLRDRLIENYSQIFATKSILLEFLRYASGRVRLSEAGPNNFFGS